MDPQKMFSGEASCEDVMQCFFNLNEFEMNLYMELAEYGPQRADTLAKKVKKDSTTVYRSLQKLISCGICFRETKTIDRGGYFHEYSAIDPKHVKKKIQDCIKQWNSNMDIAMKEFDEKFMK
jgi:predicted transcriptional regulator